MDQRQLQLEQLTLRQALLRGVTRRCPVCGKGKLFHGYFQMNTCCPHCRFPLEREPGYFLGSTYVNYGCTSVLTTATYVISHFGFGVRNEVLLPGLMAICLIFPLVFFRFARSLWLSLDCYFDRTGASEVLFRSRRTGSDKNSQITAIEDLTQ